MSILTVRGKGLEEFVRTTVLIIVLVVIGKGEIFCVKSKYTQTLNLLKDV